MAASLGPQGTLVMGMKHCEINIRDVFCEPTSPLSIWNETHLFLRTSTFSLLKKTLAFKLRLPYLDQQARSWGPSVRIGNGLLHCPLHCGYVCNGLFKWSLLLIDQCLQRALINVCYKYVVHPYSNLPACRWHLGTSQDLAAIKGCILEPARIWQPPQQGDITNTFSHHRYRQRNITFIEKQEHIYRQVRIRSHQVSSYSHQGLFGWSHEKTAWTRQYLTPTNQAKQVSQATTPD
jgi:hypothetical protein